MSRPSQFLPLAAACLFLGGCEREPGPVAAVLPSPARSAPAGYVIPEAVQDAGHLPGDVTYTRTLPGGEVQQVPDSVLPDQPPTVAEALAAAVAALEQTRETARRLREEAGGELVIVDGIAVDVVDAGKGVDQFLVDPDRSTPATTYNVCTGLALACAEVAGTVDGCLAAVPTCRSARPWEAREDCCPKACKDGYQSLRDGGVDVIEAFAATFVRDYSCVPGMPPRPPQYVPAATEGGE